MKYRVILKVRWNDLYFDFVSMVEAMTFMSAAVDNYVGSDEDAAGNDPIRFEAYLMVIKEESPADANQ